MLQKLQIYCNIIQADQNKRSIVIIELTYTHLNTNKLKGRLFQ